MICIYLLYLPNIKAHIIFLYYNIWSYRGILYFSMIQCCRCYYYVTKLKMTKPFILF